MTSNLGESPVDGKAQAHSANPFDTIGLERRSDGQLRYRCLPESMVAELDRMRRQHPDREAVVELHGGRLTYEQLWDRAGQVAGGLAEAGVVAGDRIAIRLPNGMDWVLAYFGAMLAGAIAVPINTRFVDDEAQYVVADSGAKLVVTEGAPLPWGRHHTTSPRPDTPVAIFYTSGTTGHPKGAVLTHEGVLTNCENVRRFMSLDLPPGDLAELRNLIAVPLFHVTGCHMQLLTTLSLGGTAVIMPKFTPGDFLTAIAAERINVTVSAPAIYAMIMDDPGFASTDLSTLRALYYGGAPTTPSQVRRIKTALPQARVGNGFGLTESTGVLSLLPHDEAESHADSVGYPMPCNELRIDAPDEQSGAGELLVRGPNVMREYWNNPRATAQAVNDGWLRTGDICRIDDAGRLYIVDRAKDMINRGGENVYCSEVENAVATIEAVGEVAVVGVADPTFGERVGAVVVARPGQSVDLSQFAAELRPKIAAFKIPEFVLIRSEPLPRNANGKVVKTSLRSLDWSAAVRVSSPVRRSQAS